MHVFRDLSTQNVPQTVLYRLKPKTEFYNLKNFDSIFRGNEEFLDPYSMKFQYFDLYMHQITSISIGLKTQELISIWLFHTISSQVSLT